ncbi:isocitrate dehydrogenase [NAD] subunit gamma, mitochondrial-like [Carcharodon carcharias]|uniref:isocitrate dehydrogenase [NAD] subunit gamma, mitochondrial-like n=1 Tax=Carcharodon carcharias TaxID=13397 RepID=UPI001B7F7107|nr:isocitrate dehydrogenase [NAD] subunit gamma, mitochondrial-like [Carcharodon carcharias]
MAFLRHLSSRLLPAAWPRPSRPLARGLTASPEQPRQRRHPGKLYGGRATVTLIPGDGVGPELMLHVERVFRASHAPVDFEEVRVDSGAADGRDIGAAIAAVRRNRVALKGNFETAIERLPAHRRSLNVFFRTELDLFASVNRYRSLPGLGPAVATVAGPPLDIVVIRETTEGEYAHLEHESVPGVVESLKIITRARSVRLAEFAFSYARRHGRRSLAVVHKANIMKLTDGLFLRCCREVAAGYPEIEFGSLIVDNATMQLVSQPGRFDVLVTPSLYGVVVNNICAGLVGGPGLVPGASYSHRCAVFQTAIRNTAPGLAGRNAANPTAMLLAGCLLLDHLRLGGHARLIRGAVLGALRDAGTRTLDVGGRASSTEVVDYVVGRIQQEQQRP